MKYLLPVALICLVVGLAACGDDESGDSGATTSATTNESNEAQAPADSEESSGDTANRKKPKVTVPSGSAPKQLVTDDLTEGSGAAAKAGDQVTVHYVGVGFDSGEQFDASWDRGEPFSFTLGGGEVITGWDQGVAGMKVGGRRELVIPPGQAYGPRGAPPAIGPNETLVFVVDLLDVK